MIQFGPWGYGGPGQVKLEVLARAAMNASGMVDAGPNPLPGMAKARLVVKAAAKAPRPLLRRMIQTFDVNSV